ncbi:hypothetical protein CQA38_04465 [Campylobacter sp. MIT 12-5580]|uniref:hypothetical protein n=1 Tax=Campylobacter sp. MIT 12-5580 TaxID=2040651 RepID=UPI0010F5EDCA|nr:hypothetical protein [Campylobacter sp. MIT 12-5580]TKX29342.1 hypothetical protein CQA38_04465 [Campylobacter sp. MIT 12-5580]
MSKFSQPFVHIDFSKMHTLIKYFQDTFITSYSKINEEKGIQIDFGKEFEDRVIQKVLDQYIDYAIAYELIVEDVCPYKILAWYGYIIADELYPENKQFAIEAIATSIECMLRLLEIEGINIEQPFHRKALKMVLSELRGIHFKPMAETNSKQYTKIGLGMNGLYMMFRTASVCKKI